MSDFLLQLSENPNARKVIKSLGLPIPMPQKLRRAKGPWQERPLDGDAVVFGVAPGGGLVEAVADTLAPAGAEPHIVDGSEAMRRNVVRLVTGAKLFDLLTPLAGDVFLHASTPFVVARHRFERVDLGARRPERLERASDALDIRPGVLHFGLRREVLALRALTLQD